MKKITWVDVAVGVLLIASPLALGYSACKRPVFPCFHEPGT